MSDTMTSRPLPESVEAPGRYALLTARRIPRMRTGCLTRPVANRTARW
jgi:hypothetical protein